MDKQFQWKEYLKLLQIFTATAIMPHTTTKWLCSVKWILFSNCNNFTHFCRIPVNKAKRPLSWTKSFHYRHTKIITEVFILSFLWSKMFFHSREFLWAASCTLYPATLKVFEVSQKTLLLHKWPKSQLLRLSTPFSINNSTYVTIFCSPCSQIDR